LKLHDWNVDFAAFCSYKYLNSSAGCVGGVFVHTNHFDKQYPHFDGWWGNRDETRFQMKTGKRSFLFIIIINKKIYNFEKKEIDRGIGANGFRISNPSIHQCATLAASLEVNKLSILVFRIQENNFVC
jgi:kynureninase